MKFIGKFSEKLRNPTSLFAAVWHSLTIVFAVGVVLCTVFFDALPRWVPSLVNMLSAVFFGVSVYMLAVRLFPLPKKLAAKLGRHKWLGKFFDYSFRTKFFSAISFCLNAGYALFQAVLAVLGRSVGLGALAAYYFVLASARGGLLLWDRKIADSDSPDAEREKKQARAYLFSGILLTLLTAMIVPAIIQHIASEANSFLYTGLMVYASAVYSFAKIASATLNFFRAKKQDDLIVRAMRNVSFSAALMSLFALQATLNRVFGTDPEFSMRMNAATSGIVCLLTLAMGVSMIFTGRRQLRGAGSGSDGSSDDMGSAPEEKRQPQA